MTWFSPKIMALAAVASVPAFADLIGTWNVSQNVGAPVVSDAVVVTFTAGALTSNPENLFDNVIWTMGDAGKTVTLMSNRDDPNFEAAIQALTNGLDDFVGLGVSIVAPGSPGAGIATLESNAFGTDFTGDQIDAIALTVNSLSITNPPPNSTVVLIDMAVDIYGSPTGIPEPSPRAFTCLAFMLLLSTRAILLCDHSRDGHHQNVGGTPRGT
jgi:hypothetical protein